MDPSKTGSYGLVGFVVWGTKIGKEMKTAKPWTSELSGMETPKSCLVEGREDAGLFKALVTKNLPLSSPSFFEAVSMQISFLATPL